MKLASAVYLSVLSSVAYSHFVLDYPPTRGGEEDDLNKPICGGEDEVGERTAFPLKGGKLQVTATHDATVFAQISFNSNPTNFTQFNTTSNGTAYSQIVGFNNVPEGKVCYNIDIAGLNVPDAKNGTNATLLVVYNGGEGNLFQCADLVLTENATTPADALEAGLTCKTVQGNSTTASGTATGPMATQTGDAVSLSVGLSAGVIGALVGLAIQLL